MVQHPLSLTSRGVRRNSSLSPLLLLLLLLHLLLGINDVLSLGPAARNGGTVAAQLQRKCIQQLGRQVAL